MNELNFAVIGLGEIAKTHLLAAFVTNIRNNFNYTIQPVATLTNKKQQVNLCGVKNYNDVNELFTKEKLDFVDICTPNDCHFEYVKYFSKNKIPIYCEKPLSDNIVTARRMVDMVDENKVINGVAFILRFIPAVHIIKSKLSDNIIGRVINFKLSMYHGSYLNTNRETWKNTSRSGGGVLLDSGSHLVDLANFIFSETYGKICDIQADLKIHFTENSKVEEYASCKVITEKGLWGNIEVSRISAEEVQRNCVEIFGEKGSLKLNMQNPYKVIHYDYYSGNSVTYFATEDITNPLNFPKAKDALGYFQSAHTASLATFSQLVWTGEKPNVMADFKDALYVQELINEAYKKSKDIEMEGNC